MPTGAFERIEAIRKQRISRRAFILGAAQAGGFVLLAGRMYQLQVLESDRYSKLAEKNRIGMRLEIPTRGVILDRSQRPLAINSTAYRVSIVPESTENIPELLDLLDELVPLPPSQRSNILEQAKKQKSFIPITVYDRLSWLEIARIGVNSPSLSGVEISAIKRRVYPNRETGAHIIGYVGAVSKNELKGDPVLSHPDFRIGKAGVERAYDLELRGQAGTRKVEVNAVGRTVRELERTPEQIGAALTLAIDSRLQRFATELFGSETGAAIVMDAHNGEVLSLVSLPSFDPNAFTDGISHKDWQQLITAPDAPLVNKAIAGQYAPGSTFKMVVALAGLEAGLITPDTAYFCPGFLEVGNGRFHCWSRGGHGKVNMHKGIVQSCDVYFYEVARRIGIDRIAEMARKLGFGHVSGIDLPGELAGLIPDKEWKKKNFETSWQIGESLIAGIGQGYVLSTPIQLAVMTARLVNDGKAILPHLAKSAGESTAFPTLGLNPDHVEAILKAMVGVTTEPAGTALASQIPVPEMRMGGKTGTSQVRRISTRERRFGVLTNDERPREHRDHALFVGFAPIDRPRFVTAVIVEHGGGGSKAAAPIARDLLMETQLRMADAAASL